MGSGGRGPAGAARQALPRLPPAAAWWQKAGQRTAGHDRPPAPAAEAMAEAMAETASRTAADTRRAPMAESALPVVATSVNPVDRSPDRMAHQLRCFAAWKALGFEVLSFNHPAEIEALRRAGLAAEDILPAMDHETGLETFGKPVPRIAALLARLARLRPGRAVILVNSDIYPAAGDPGFARFWLDQAPALALTREEAACLEAADFTTRAPYRGGLDTFMLGAPALVAILGALAGLPAAGRMCFGMPGWDYLMGALLASDRIGGRIMDSGILLHQTHPQAYAGIDEFAHYLPAMAALGLPMPVAPDPRQAADAAARRFAERIARDCAAHAGTTRLVRAMHFRPVAGHDPCSAEALRICRDLQALLPALCWTHNLAVMARVAERIRAEPGTGFGASLALMVSERPGRQQLAEILAAALFHLDCRGPGFRALTERYPPGNLHARAIRVILDGTGGRPALREVEIARLFCSELVDHGLFNPRLYNWLALGCMNDTERGLLQALRARIGARMVRDAA